MSTKSKIRILVVEDDDGMSSLIQSMLTANGYDVAIARDGEEGERLFKSDHNYDLVITDLGLPKVTGEELFYRLRSIQPDLKIIASSGYEKDNIVAKMKNDGLNAFIPKPYIALNFLRIVSDVLNG